MEAFLIPIYHGLPVEATFVADAAAIWKLCEVDLCEERFEVWEEVMEAWRFVGDGGEKKAGLG